MSVKSAQAITRTFMTIDPQVGSAVDADALPTGVLAVNGTDNAAVVAVTNVATGRYKAAVTLPTLAAGDGVELVVTATVNGITGKAVIWRDTADSALPGEVYSRLGAPAGASLAADVGAVKSDVADVFDDLQGVRAVGDAVVSAANVADAVWDEAATGHTDAGKAGTQLWTDVDAILLKTNLLGATAINITNPVAADLTVTVTEGDDYDATHGLQITIPVADSTHLLGLDDAAAVVKLVATQADWTASAVTATAEGYDVTFEPTAAETALLTIARQSYQLKATLADGDVVTPVEGDLVTRASLA